MIRRTVRLAAVAAFACVMTAAGAAESGVPSLDPEAPMRSDSRGYVVLAVDNPLHRVPNRAGTSLGGYSTPPRYVVGDRAAVALSSIEREYGLKEAVAAWPIVPLEWHCVVYGVPAGMQRDALIEALARDRRVRLIQPLQDFALHSVAGAETELRYNDPYVSLQRGFVETSAAQAHRVSTGRGVAVALVDTGADLRHADLRGRVVASRDFVAAANGQSFEDDRHGTQVAGVIAAVGNNREGIVGIAPQAVLSIYKGCWEEKNSIGRCNSFTLAKALAAVLESDARLVNLSLGGPPDPLLNALVRQLLQQGRVVIGALPDSGRPEGFPAGVPGVIVVGSSGASSVAGVLNAPGLDVLTLAPGGRYDFASGSSIAAAHATGIAALLLALQPHLDGAAVQSLLGASATIDKRLQVNAEAALGLMLKRESRTVAASSTTR